MNTKQVSGQIDAALLIDPTNVLTYPHELQTQDQIAVLEFYAATGQGEGYYTGVPSLFLRSNYCPVGCSFCVDGDTPITLADYTTKRAKNLQVGELLLSPGKRASHIPSRLEAVVTREAPVVRVTTASGRKLIVSNDHRFDAYRPAEVTASYKTPSAGKYYVEAQHSLGWYLRGLNWTEVPCEEEDIPTFEDFGIGVTGYSEEFMRGYVQGAILGDGSISYSKQSKHYMLYFMVLDEAFAERVSQFINYFCPEQQRTPSSPLWSLTRPSGPVYQMVYKFTPDLEWIAGLPETKEECRGFISGFYDAEGNYTNSQTDTNKTHQVKLSQKNVATLERIQQMLLNYWGIESSLLVDVDDKVGSSTLQLSSHGSIYAFGRVVDSVIERKQIRPGSRRSLLAKDEVIAVEQLAAQTVYSLTTQTGWYFSAGVISRNCDTTFSWSNRSSAVRLMEAADIVKEAIKLRESNPGIAHVVYTGGEPMLQPSKAVYRTLSGLSSAGFAITIETSGIANPFITMSSYPWHNIPILWSIAPKLPSAEANYDFPNLGLWVSSVLHSNQRSRLTNKIQFKFVLDPNAASYAGDWLHVKREWEYLLDSGLALDNVWFILQPVTRFQQKDIDFGREQVLSALEKLQTSIATSELAGKLAAKGAVVCARPQTHFLLYGNKRGV